MALKVKEKELTAKYPARHPEVRQVRQQLAAAQALLKGQEGAREQVTTGPSKLYEEAELALQREEPVLAALKARAAALRDQLAQERKQLEAFNRDQVRIVRQQREVDLAEGHYRKYADNLQQLQVDTALASEKLSNISVVQPATFDAEPVKPRLLAYLGGGFLAALLGGLGLVLLCERLDRSLKTPEEVQHQLGLPVLASVPCLGREPSPAPNGKRVLSR
jgi:uncharacterized protein involved in exopolysaccharide biosynthesis